MLDVYHACDGADGFDEKLRRGVRIDGQIQELYAHEGDLRGEVFEFQGVAKGFLLLRRQSCGVEAVLAGVLVAVRSPAAISLERCDWPRVKGLVMQGVLEVLLSGHGMRIREAMAYGEGGDGRRMTSAKEAIGQ